MIPLSSSDIHLWHISADGDYGPLNQLKGLLSSEERDRADRFLFPELHHNFVTFRAALRLILSRYSGVKAQSIRLAYGDRGKPRLAGNQLPPIRFNLSHSHRHAVLGVCLNEDIGVDVEYEKAIRDMDGIAKRFFSEREYALLKRYSGKAFTAAFYRIWTRKEAFIKWEGSGLFRALDSFSVNASITHPKLLASQHHDAREFRVKAIDGLPEGYWGAFVTKKRNVTLSIMNFGTFGMDS